MTTSTSTPMKFHRKGRAYGIRRPSERMSPVRPYASSVDSAAEAFMRSPPRHAPAMRASPRRCRAAPAVPHACRVLRGVLRRAPRISSACRTADSRCATITVVRPRRSSLSRPRIRFSVLMSTADRLSSRISTGACLSNARAIAVRCFLPAGQRHAALTDDRVEAVRESSSIPS